MPSDPALQASDVGLADVERRRRPWLAAAAVLAILGALVGADSFLAAWRQSLQPTEEARWIWMRGANRFVGASAFFVARDFELSEVPDAVALSVLADEEYVLYLNGTRVGSNRYVSGAGLDRYRVEPLLREGRNRITAHLRSSRSTGAFLALLQTIATGESIVWTDESWHVIRRRMPRLTRLDLPLQLPEGRPGEYAIVVGRPPEGKWGSPGLGVERLLHSEVIRERGPAAASRILLPGGGWRRRYPRIRYTRPLGPHVVFDWGQVRTGYLVLHFPAARKSTALVYLGLQTPNPVAFAPDAYVIISENETHWEDTVPRAFRYALVVGLPSVTDAELILTLPDRLPVLPAESETEGVFGLTAPRLRSPIENEVWRELEGFAGNAEGED